MLLTLLLTSRASLAGVTGDLQLRVLPSAGDFAATWIEGLDPSIYSPDLGDRYDCWDRVGIQNFNLDVPIETVGISMDQDELTVDVSFGDVVGTDMLLYTLDAEFTDSCTEFDADLLAIALTGGFVSLTLRAVEDRGELAFVVVGTPTVTGDLIMDIDWFPDDLVLYFLEETIFAAVADSIAEEVGPVLSDYFGRSLYAGELEGYSMNLTLDDLALSSSGLDLGLGMDLAFVGEPACDVGSASAPGGRSPSIPLTAPAGADLGIGLTEAMLNQVMFEAWESGAICVEPSTFAELTEDMEDLVDPSVSELHGAFSLAKPPELTIGARGATIALTGAKLGLEGSVSGESAEVLSVTMNIEADAAFGTDASLSSVVLHLTALDIEFTNFSAAHLKSTAYVEELVAEAVRRFAAAWITDWLQNIVLFDSLYSVWDIGLRIESFDTAEGGLVIWATLWDLDDPAVDQNPPQTSAELQTQDGETVTVRFGGTDDKATELAWSVQIDGGGWSGWTGEETAVFDLGHPGEHTIEVKARDGWQNEDPTPVLLAVTVTEKGTGSSSCGCQTSSDSVGWGLLASGLLWVRRRGRAAVGQA